MKLGLSIIGVWDGTLKQVQDDAQGLFWYDWLVNLSDVGVSSVVCEPAVSQKDKILVLDFSDSVASSLTQLLSESYEVVASADQGTFLDLLEGHSPKVLVVDDSVSGDAFYECVRAAKAVFWDVQVVYLRRLCNGELKDFEGVSFYVRKPIHVASLLMAVKQAVLYCDILVSQKKGVGVVSGDGWGDVLSLRHEGVSRMIRRLEGDVLALDQRFRGNETGEVIKQIWAIRSLLAQYRVQERLSQSDFSPVVQSVDVSGSLRQVLEEMRDVIAAYGLNFSCESVSLVKNVDGSVFRHVVSALIYSVILQSSGGETMNLDVRDAGGVVEFVCTCRSAHIMDFASVGMSRLEGAYFGVGMSEALLREIGGRIMYGKSPNQLDILVHFPVF